MLKCQIFLFLIFSKAFSNAVKFMKLILPNSNRRIRRTNHFGAQLAQKAEFWANDNGFKRMQWATFGSGTDYIYFKPAWIRWNSVWSMQKWTLRKRTSLEIGKNRAVWRPLQYIILSVHELSQNDAQNWHWKKCFSNMMFNWTQFACEFKAFE